MPKKLTQAEFESRMVAIHGDAFDLSNSVYIGRHKPITVGCPTHGQLSMLPHSLLNGRGCQQCYWDRERVMTTEEFIAKATEVHGDTYDYSQVVYRAKQTPITVVCKVHGPWQTAPETHLRGHTCLACSDEKKARTQEEFLQEARAVHGDKYDYADTVYTRNKANITYKCGVHGLFTQVAGEHLRGRGCFECRVDATRTTKEEFIAHAQQVHGTTYDYSKVVMGKNISTHVEIGCKKHGSFWQTPSQHAGQKQGCPSCANRISNAETEVADMLREHTTVETQFRIGGKEIDMFLPDHGIAVEFNGEVFHADTAPYTADPNPKGRTKHREREDMCKANGLRLIQIWGSQWKHRRPVMERLLLSAIGKDPAPVVGARQCVVDPAVSFREAMEFYEANHPQGKGTSNAKNWGLRDKSTGVLVACMSFSMSADRRGKASSSWDGASLTRYATSHRVPGGASKLLKAWMAANPGVAVMSYSDPMLFAGTTYATLGFKQVKRIDPDYLCFDPVAKMLHHKSAFQRKNLEAWRQKLKRDDVAPFDAATDPRTEFQMEDAMGIKRVWNTGLIRWELHP
jgi:hypothetical protein